jgi:hypothetical protein
VDQLVNDYLAVNPWCSLQECERARAAIETGPGMPVGAEAKA